MNWPKSSLGGVAVVIFFTAARVVLAQAEPVDNTLSPQEKAAGWILLFNGDDLDGWRTSGGSSSKVPVENHAINPHGCGGYMMIHDQPQDDFVLTLDFKISERCNSGV